MTAAMIGDPTRPRDPDRRGLQPAAAPTTTGMEAEKSIPSLRLLFGNQFGSRQAAEDRLLTLLDGWIVEGCRESIDGRLAGLSGVARAAMLPAPPARMMLAREVLAGLPPSMLIGLLSPQPDAERALLLHQAGSPDPMLREAALDALSGLQRPGPVLDRVRQGCLALLEPGFALLGAGPASPDGRAGSKEPATASTREAAILAALRQDDRRGAMQLLGQHAGMDSALVADAVWRRDSRSLFGLAWRAGYSTRTAILLQSQLAGIPQRAALRPAENGVSPMDRGEIAWQLAVLEGD